MEVTTHQVRPVIRHSVTRNRVDDTTRTGSHAVLCEVHNEEVANEIMEALAFRDAPRYYVIVQRSFDCHNNIVIYAEEREQADEYCKQLTEFYNTDFRVFEQVITDPVKLAHYEVRRKGGWLPLVLPLVPLKEGEKWADAKLALPTTPL